ncbi:MAG: hypothetical protein H6Q41_2264 [Deltaproteobacteria bacterium]|nr:hypothetical protein [Deltaproteobacteria bacterium]
MITMTVAVKLGPHKEKEFLQFMSSLQEKGKEVKGLRDLKVCQPNKGRTHFDVVYEWEGERDMRNYLEMEHFKVFRGAVAVLCRESEIRCSDFLIPWLQPCSSCSDFLIPWLQPCSSQRTDGDGGKSRDKGETETLDHSLLIL